MIATPRSIVAAVDFGDASARAVTIAGAIAERCRAELTLVHAESLEAPAYFTSEQIEALERQRHALHVQAEQFLYRFGRRHTPVPFTARIDDRHPVDAIASAAQAADLVVMGTHGRHGPKRWWLGSVAERVLREIPRPLLVVRADAPSTGLFDRPVLHVPGDLDHAGVTQYAHALAACFGGRVQTSGGDPVETAAAGSGATIAIVAAPQPRTTAWLTRYGEPLVHHATVPLLFLPPITEGVVS